MAGILIFLLGIRNTLVSSLTINRTIINVRRFINLFRWGTVIVILLTFVAYLAPYVNPESFWPISFFGVVYPWLLAANVIVMLGWLVLRKKYFLLSLGCIMLGWNHLSGFVGMSFAANEGKGIKVMTYNVRYLSSLRAKDEKHARIKQKAFTNFMKNNRPDILCIQESARRTVELLARDLGYKHVHRIERKGTAILSDFPLIEKGKVDFGTNTNSCLWADFKIKEDTVRVYSIHFQSNRVSGQADDLMKDGNIQEKETWKTIGGMISNVKQASKRRARQALQVARHIAMCKKPIIVCGDFNDTPQSYTYNLISKHLQDAFRKKGSGLGTTYAGSIPALRIDYVLVDKKIEVLDCEILKESFSDHYPVVSRIRLR